MDVPEWLIAEAKTKRMVAHMRSIMSGGDGDWDMATYADAIIHLYLRCFYVFLQSIHGEEE